VKVLRKGWVYILREMNENVASSKIPPAWSTCDKKIFKGFKRERGRERGREREEGRERGGRERERGLWHF
jgi:hypothetical protein